MNANASALCAATEPTPSAAIQPTLPTQLLSAIGRFQECDTPTGMRVSLPGCDMPSKGEASETAVAGRGLSAAMTYMGKGGVCKKPKISLSSLGTPAAARQKREDVSIMPEEWAQLGYQGSSRLGQDSRDASSIAGSTKSRLSPASTSLFSFFSRPNKPLGLPGTEKLGCGGDAGARQRASTLLNKTEGAGVQDGGNKDVEDSKDTEEASAKEAFEKGKQWSREEASRGAAAAWSNILCMKKQAASRPPALAPTYLSSKEQAIHPRPLRAACLFSKCFSTQIPSFFTCLYPCVYSKANAFAFSFRMTCASSFCRRHSWLRQQRHHSAPGTASRLFND